MRLTSTPESARAGEPSLLAIIETLAAMAASAWIGVHFGTWTHIAVGACIAPFLLLRTEESCQYVVQCIRDLSRWICTKLGVVGMGVSLPTFVAPVTAIRVWAILVHVIPHPVIALRAFPGNRRRTTIALDSATSPEWIPVPADMSEHHQAPDFGRVYGLARSILSETRREVKKHGGLGRIGYVILAVFIVGPLFVTAVVSGLAYRWSIKSTAIIWAPMLWALRPPKPKGEAWSAHLKLKATSDFNRIVVIFSTLVLLGFLVKYAFFVAEHELALRAGAWHGRLGEFVAAFVRPGEFPIWQLASATNAVLAIVVFFMVRSWLRHAEVGLPAPDTRIDRTLGVLYFFRRLLTSYAIFCNGVVAIQLARKLPMPEIGSKLFPWL